MNFADEIPLDVAIAAHCGTSHTPEKRGEQERAGYAATLTADYQNLAQLAGTDEAKKADLVIEWERYHAGYRQRFLAQLRSKAHCVSTMITGRSNFNVRRAQKRSDIADRRTTDLLEYRVRALAAIRKVLQPELRPIMAGDSNAQDRLKKKLSDAEKLQERMKAANAAIRKNAQAGEAAQVAALVAQGFSEPRARDLLKPDFAGRVGFADFELKNNGAEIRRLQGRLTQVTTAQATPATSWDGESGCSVEDVPAENRVRVFFPSKPSADVRNHLGASGFRWTPSLNCWQAYRSDSTIATAKAVAGVAANEQPAVQS